MQCPTLARPHDSDEQPELRQLGGEVFGDRIIATATLDRIFHHATLNIRGNSYRLNDKLKAGLVRPAEATE